MKKMPKVDTYDPVIYPRLLWVSTELEGLNNIFIFCSMNDPKHEEIGAYEDLLKELDSGTGVLATCPIINKATRQYGVLTIILKPEELEGGDAAHEAVHIADYIFEQLGMYSQQFHDNNEQYAYLVGWAAGCISKTIIKNIKNDTRRESDDVEA